MKSFHTSLNRAVEIWRETLWLRRQFFKDQDFFKVPDLWDEMCEDNPDFRTKLVSSRKGLEDYQRRAGIIAFGDKATMIVDEVLIEKARLGQLLSNFTLAHEIEHLVLGHHETGAIVKYFQLFDGPTGKANVPPTLEEYETNIGAVILQCGIALLDPHWETYSLALRAYSDPHYVRIVQKMVQLEVFQRALGERERKYPRVIL